MPSELSGGELPHFDNAIWWYSCNEAPIFDQMNNILRLENFELLMCHRYYISDLCQMIERIHAQHKFTRKCRVYRADKLSLSDFETLKTSMTEKNARITINGFISTSRNEKISLEYAASKLSKQGDDVVILYEITIDPAIPCSAYADIQSISFHPREEEILFNMGSTFEIDEIENDKTNPKIQRIKLTAREFNLNLIDEMKAKVKQSSQATLSILLVRYLIELGEDRVSKRYLNQLIESKQLQNDVNLVLVYNCLGDIHLRQELYGEALSYYRQALDAQARLEFSNNTAMAEVYNKIGQAYLGLNQLDEAQQNLEEGVRVQKREPKYSQQHLASLYCSLGRVAYARRDWDEAETNFQLSYDLFNRNSRISHDALEKRLLQADLCIAFGNLKSVKSPGDELEANEKFEEALDIYNCILPSTHPKVADAHIEIVCEYMKNKNFRAVINYQDEEFESLLKDYENKRTTSQMDLAQLYAQIGACYAFENEFDQAMDCWMKSFHYEQKAFLDELLSASRVSKIEFQLRSVENAWRCAFKHYKSSTDAPKEYMAFLYHKMKNYQQVIEILRGENSFLLGHVCVSIGKLKSAMVVYRRIQEMKKGEIMLNIGLLLRMLTTFDSDEPAKELLEIDKSLENRIDENESMRLRMVINDHLGEFYLNRKKLAEARLHASRSLKMKQRFYSAHHTSISRNYRTLAACFYRENDWRNAVQTYEKASEIQLENLPDDHQEVRSTYFLMGDCYCQMDKTESAQEFYRQAQMSNESDDEEDKEIEHDTKNLLRMNWNLSEMNGRQKEFVSAIEHQKNRIEIIEEILPAFIVDLVNDDEESTVSLSSLEKVVRTRVRIDNGEAFARILRNVLLIDRFYARALLKTEGKTDDELDSTDLFERAIELHKKLTLYDDENEETVADAYKELSEAYGILYSSMKESIRENLAKALEETNEIDRQRQIECPLGNLYFDEDIFTVAQRHWKNAWKKIHDNHLAKKIIEKLLEKNQENLSSSDEESDDELPNIKRANSDVEKEENDEKMADAYLYLNDQSSALKHFKRLSEKFSTDWKSISIESERLPLIKAFFTILTDWIRQNSSNFAEKTNEFANRLQIEMKIFTIALRTPDTFDLVNQTIVAIYHLSSKLCEIPDYFDELFQSLHGKLDELRWSKYYGRMPINDQIKYFLALAELYVVDEEWSEALQIYCDIQEQSEISSTLKSAVDYGLGKLLELYVVSLESHQKFILAIDMRSPSIPIFDRLILCRLIIAYMEEVEDDKGLKQWNRELANLQREPWPHINLTTCESIGKTLAQFEQHSLACLYWGQFQTLYNGMFPGSLVNRFYAPETTFEQLYSAAEQSIFEISFNIRSMAESYERLCSYQNKNQADDDAKESLDRAIAIYQKLPSAAEKVQSLKIKPNEMN